MKTKNINRTLTILTIFCLGLCFVFALFGNNANTKTAKAAAAETVLFDADAGNVSGISLWDPLDPLSLYVPLSFYVPNSDATYNAGWGGLAKNTFEDNKIKLYSVRHTGWVPHLSVVNITFANSVNASDITSLTISVSRRMGNSNNYDLGTCFNRLYAVNDNLTITDSSSRYVSLDSLPVSNDFQTITLNTAEDILKLANSDGYIKTIQYNGHFNNGDGTEQWYYISSISYTDTNSNVGYLFNNNSSDATLSDPFDEIASHYISLPDVSYNPGWGGTTRNKLNADNTIHLYTAPQTMIPHYSIINITLATPIFAETIDSLKLTVSAVLPANYNQTSGNYFNRIYAINDDGTVKDSSNYIDLDTELSHDGSYHTITLSRQDVINKLANSDGYIKTIQYNGHFDSGDFSFGEDGFKIKSITYESRAVANAAQRTVYKNQIQNYLSSTTYDTAEAAKIAEIKTYYKSVIDELTYLDEIQDTVAIAKAEIDDIATLAEKSSGSFYSLDYWGFSDLDYNSTGSVTINDGAWTKEGIYATPHSADYRNSGSIDLLIDFSTFTASTCLRFNVDVFAAVIYRDRIELDRWLGERDTIIKTFYYGETYSGVERISVYTLYDDNNAPNRTVLVRFGGITYHYYGGFSGLQSFPCGLTAYDGNVRLTSTHFKDYTDTIDSSLYSTANKTLMDSYITKANNLNLSYSELLFAQALPTAAQANMHLNATSGTDATTGRAIRGIVDIRDYYLKDGSGNAYDYNYLNYNVPYYAYWNDNVADGTSNFISGGIRFVMNFGNSGIDTDGTAKTSGLIWRFGDEQLRLYQNRFSVCRYDSDAFWEEYNSVYLRTNYTGKQVVIISLIGNPTSNNKDIYVSIGGDEYHLSHNTAAFFGLASYLLWLGNGSGSSPALEINSSLQPITVDGKNIFVAYGDTVALEKQSRVGYVHAGWVSGDAIYSPTYSFTYDGVSSYNFVPLFVELYMIDGAWVRCTSEVTGIRFANYLGNTDIAALSGKVSSYGIIILPKDLIDGDLTVNSYKVGLVDFGFESGNRYAVVKDIRFANYNREFSARSFIQIDFADGTDYVYTDIVTRSVYEVALMTMQHETDVNVINASSSFINGVIDLDLFNLTKAARTYNTGYTVNSITENSTNNFTVSVSTNNQNIRAVSVNGIPLINGTSFGGIYISNLSISAYNGTGYTITFSLGYYDKTGAIAYLEGLAADYEGVIKQRVESIVATALENVDSANSASEILNIIGEVRKTIATFRKANVPADYGTKLATPVLNVAGAKVSWSAVPHADGYIVYDSSDESTTVLDSTVLSYVSSIVGTNTIRVRAFGYNISTAMSDTAETTVEVPLAYAYNGVNTGAYNLSAAQIKKLSNNVYQSAGLYYYNTDTGFTDDEELATSYALPGDKNADIGSDEYNQYLRTKNYLQDYKDAGLNVITLGDNAGFNPFDGVSGGYYKDTETLIKFLDIAWEVGLKVIVFDTIINNSVANCYYSAFVDNGIDGIGAIGKYDGSKPVNQRATLNANGLLMKGNIEYSLSQYIKHPAFYGVFLVDEPSDGYNVEGRFYGEVLNGHTVTKYESREMEVIGVIYNMIKDYCDSQGVDCYIMANLYGTSVSVNEGSGFYYYNFIAHYLDATGASEFSIDVYVPHIYSSGDPVNHDPLIVSYAIATQIAMDRGVKFNAVSTAFSFSESGSYALRGSDVMFNAFYAKANGAKDRFYFMYSPCHWREPIYNSMVGYNGETNGTGYLYVDRVNDSLDIIDTILEGYSLYSGEFVASDGTSVQLQYRTLANGNQVLTTATQNAIRCFKATFKNGDKIATVYVPMRDTTNFGLTVSGNFNYRFNVDGTYYDIVNGSVSLSYGQCLISFN